MKILFVADIHINLRHKKVPKEWARKRYEILFDELNRVYEDYGCELEIHGGDVFDKLPTLEELEIYYSYIRGNKLLIIFDGNHEATKKGHTFFHIIKDTIENQNKYAEVLVEPCNRYGIDFIPYTHLKTFDYVKTSDILCTHVRGEIPPHVTPEVNLDKFKDWKLVLAGDLHSHSNSQKNIVYPGSPVSVSFHRNKIETGVLVVDTDTLEWEWVKLKVPQLYRKTVDKPEDMVSTHFDFTIYELTGDIVELSKVSGENSLLDKKVFNYKNDSTLDLKDLTVREEVILYFKQIHKLSEEQIDRIMRVFDDNVKTIEVE